MKPTFIACADPGVGSVAAQVHARGVTVNRLADLLDQGLESAGVLLGSETGGRNGNELLGAVERAAHAAGAEWRAPVVVVDGLDEARDQAFGIASELLVPSSTASPSPGQIIGTGIITNYRLARARAAHRSRSGSGSRSRGCDVAAFRGPRRESPPLAG